MNENQLNTATGTSSNQTTMSLPIGEGRSRSSSVEQFNSSIVAGGGRAGESSAMEMNSVRPGSSYTDQPRERTPSTAASDMAAAAAAAESTETDTFPPAGVHPARANATRSRSYAGYQASRPPPLTGLEQSPFTTTHYYGNSRQGLSINHDNNGLNDFNNDDLKSSRESLMSPLCTTAPSSFVTPQRGESLPPDISATAARLNAVDIDIDDDNVSNRRVYNRGGYGGGSIPSYQHSFSSGNAGGGHGNNNLSAFPTPPRTAHKGPSPLTIQQYHGGSTQHQQQYETRGGSVPPSTYLSSARLSKHSGARSASFQTDSGTGCSSESNNNTLTRNNNNVRMNNNTSYEQQQLHKAYQYGPGNGNNYYNNGGGYGHQGYNEPPASSPSSSSNASANNNQQVINDNGTGYQQRILPAGGMPLSPTATTPKTTRVIDRSLADYLSQLMKDKSKLEAITGVMANSPGVGPTGANGDNGQFLHLPRLLEDEIIQVRVQLFEPEDQQPPLVLPEPAGSIVRCEKRVPIPVNEYPNFNFVGRILGPRGLTVQQLEKKTGCKIMIRGKGSQHDKKKEDSHRMGRAANDQNEPLHVLISAEDHENRAKLKVKEGEAEIRKLLVVPTSEGGDELKKRQLLELAILNGTYRGGNQSGATPQASGTGRNASGAVPSGSNFTTRTNSGFVLTYGSGGGGDPHTPIETAYDPNTGTYFHHHAQQQAYASSSSTGGGGRNVMVTPLSFRANSGRNYSGQQPSLLQQSLRQASGPYGGAGSYMPLSCAPGNGTQMLTIPPASSASAQIAYGQYQQPQQSNGNANGGIIIAQQSATPSTQQQQQQQTGYGSLYSTGGTVTLMSSGQSCYEQQQSHPQQANIMQMSGNGQQQNTGGPYPAFYQQQQTRPNGLIISAGQQQPQQQMIIVPAGQPQQQTIGTSVITAQQQPQQGQQQFSAMFGATGAGQAMQANQTAAGFMASLPPYVQAGLQMTQRNSSGTGF